MPSGFAKTWVTDTPNLRLTPAAFVSGSIELKNYGEHMFTFNFHTRSSLSMGVALFALAIGAPCSFANAAVVDEAATATAQGENGSL